MTGKTQSDEDFVKFMTSLTSEQLGNLVAEYVNESVHSSWDGHPLRDVFAYRALFRDIMTYHVQATVGHEDHFDKPGFGGVTHFTKVG